jgi:hypothetical protein
MTPRHDEGAVKGQRRAVHHIDGGREWLRVQSGARRRGIAGIHGNGGILESATYRI